MPTNAASGPARHERRTCSRPPRPLPVSALVPALLVAACGPPAVIHPVIPAPAEIRVDADGGFVVDTMAVIRVEAAGEDAFRVGRMLAELIGSTVESTPVVLGPADTGPPPDLVLARDAALGDRLGAEGYTLRVSEAGVRVTAAEPAGLFYGAQTLRQLLPAEVEYTARRPAPLTLPRVEIEDRPRFGWRGAMLDVTRHFFEVEEVKRYIDLLAMHKLNRLHLHLSDDQGWRIEIPGWPALTEHGGSTEVGGGPGGYYTAEDYTEIVRYAADRFITVVPEIDMPGHTNAALASYPELNCDGVAPPLYTGIRVGFSALCAEKEVTYRFVDDVIRILAGLTPGPWIHIGGDEVEELSQAQYNTFIERVQEIVHGHGKRMIGWGEIAAADLAPTTLIQHWRGEGAGLDAAGPGQVILSPATRVYLDIRYREEIPIGLTWAGLNDLRDAYDWEPAEIIQGLPPAAIAGIEAPLWTETVATLHDLEYMAFPRLAAVAELAWSPAERRDWDEFRQRLARQGLRWTALGVNFYRSDEVDWEDW